MRWSLIFLSCFGGLLAVFCYWRGHAVTIDGIAWHTTRKETAEVTTQAKELEQISHRRGNDG